MWPFGSTKTSVGAKSIKRGGSCVWFERDFFCSYQRLGNWLDSWANLPSWDFLVARHEKTTFTVGQWRFAGETNDWDLIGYLVWQILSRHNFLEINCTHYKLLWQMLSHKKWILPSHPKENTKNAEFVHHHLSVPDPLFNQYLNLHPKRHPVCDLTKLPKKSCVMQLWASF